MKRFGAILGLSVAFGMAGCGTPASNLDGDATAGLSGRQTFASQSEAPRSVVRIYVQNHDQVQALARKGLDLFEDVNMRLGYVDATVDDQDAAFLRAAGYRFDITGSSASRPQAMTAGTFDGGYHSVDEVEAAFKQMAQTYPKIARFSVPGKSLKGNDIFMLEISANPGNAPQILFDSGQHARELPPVELTYRLAQSLVSSYGTDPNITKLVDTRDIYIVPIVNPDGRKDVESGDAYWRKNMRDNGDGTMGVDTNRNSDDHWDQGDKETDADDYG
ncbi:MAG: hypothetical protein KGR26_04440, partial [Cyanobacteria bacterium REEB65]|nr:hypothetical protein [Cyanobacteria bacterium REEB65]